MAAVALSSEITISIALVLLLQVIVWHGLCERFSPISTLLSFFSFFFCFFYHGLFYRDIRDAHARVIRRNRSPKR